MSTIRNLDGLHPLSEMMRKYAFMVSAERMVSYSVPLSKPIVTEKQAGRNR